MNNCTYRKILVLDDCDITIKAIQSALLDTGYLVECTDTVEKAVISYHNNPRPDLLILDNDLGFGEILGVDVLDILDKKVPIVMHSGNNSIKKIALDNGAIDFIQKDRGLSKLVSSIKVILKHRPDANNIS